MNYQPIHCRSVYSFLRGVLRPEEICSLARAQGAEAVGMVDLNGFSGLPAFLRATGNYGLKPVVGVAVEWGGVKLLTAFCLNSTGYRNINRLITAMNWWSAPVACRESPMAHCYPRTSGSVGDPVSCLLEHGWEGLALVSSDRAILARLMERSRESLYAGLFYKRVSREFVLWAERHCIPTIALNDAIAASPHHRELHSLLSAISRGSSHLDRHPSGESLDSSCTLASDQELTEYFAELPGAVEGQRRVIAETDAMTLPDSYILPEFDGLTEREASRRLAHICSDGLHRRYPESAGGTPDAVKERLRRELRVVLERGFSGYFLIVHDLVTRFPRTSGRGSATASLIAYLLGITSVDPVRYNLFFEGFLHSERKTAPDIDIDFPWDERSDALCYMMQRYAGHVAMVADHVTFAARSSFREACRGYGIDRAAIGELTELWEGLQHEGGTSDGEQSSMIPEVVIRGAEILKGLPRHLGTHPGGVVVTPHEISNYAALHLSGTGLPVIPWEKRGTKAMGLVKLDLLGNRGLAVLRDSMREINLRRTGGEQAPLTWSGFVPIDDDATRRMIERGDTLGIFNIESPETRRVLTKSGSGRFEDVMVAGAIVRPAANPRIDEYVRRLGGGKYRRLDSRAEETLKGTLGLMVYQEDVVRLSMEIAGFPVSLGDRLRKALDSTEGELLLSDFRIRFLEGASQRGVPAGEAEQLWNQIEEFRGYSFCKAHSASYAMLSYRLGWIKLRYPLVFFCSVINNGGGFYPRQVYLNQVRRMGITILPPDLNASMIPYTVDRGALRVGLGQLRGISSEFLGRVVAERERGGVYRDLRDFVQRIDPGFVEIRVLIRAGALDGIAGGVTRPQLFWLFHALRKPSSFSSKMKRSELLGAGRLLLLPPPPPRLKEYSTVTRIADELEHLRLIITRHPLTIYAPRIERCLAGSFGRLQDSRSIPQMVGQKIVLAGSTTCRKRVFDKNGRSMCFIGFEDPYGLFDVVVFARYYRKVSSILRWGRTFLVFGLVEEELGTYHIRVEELQVLDRPR